MLKSGHRIVPVTGKEQDKLVEDLKMYDVGTIRLEPGRWFFTSPFILFADQIYDFKFRPNDVVIVTFPKSGTTWTQEIVWTMRNNPNLNHPDAYLPILDRSPQLDMDFVLESTSYPDLSAENDFKEKFKKLFPEKKVEDGVHLQILDATPDPRTIKSHLPISLMNPNLIETCKVIYVARNPKDVAVSYYHLMKLFAVHGFNGTIEETVNYFTTDKLMWGPYWKHMKNAWDLRHHPNLHFVHYEDLNENPRNEIIQFQKFLKIQLTDQQINNIVEYTSFSAMKERDNMYGEISKEKNMQNKWFDVEHIKKDGGFFRKGVVGDWKNRLTAEQAKRIDEWTKRNVEVFGPDFKYRI